MRDIGSPAGHVDLSALPSTITKRETWQYGLPVLATLIVGGILLRLANATGIAEIQNFLLITTALLIEALPFILLGAIVGAAIHFVPPRIFDRVARLPRALQMPLAGLGGFAFPVCECGSVPVARHMVMKGLAPPAAITFMLAAPILNPIVLWPLGSRTAGVTSCGPWSWGAPGWACSWPWPWGWLRGPGAGSNCFAHRRT